MKLVDLIVQLIEQLDSSFANVDMKVVIATESTTIDIQEVTYNSHTGEIDLLTYDRFAGLEEL
jgi:hypothetical protein